MTKHENPSVLEDGAQKVFVPTTREQLLRSAIDLFRQRPNQKFRLYHGLEFMTNEHLLELKTSGTILQPLEEAMAAANLPTDGTVKSLMQPPLLLTSHDLHAISCDCHEGATHTEGVVAALMFQGRFGL
jgi:hypothetical protein